MGRWSRRSCWSSLVLFDGGSTYTLKANFQNASGLVTGNLVLIGPATVGSVQVDRADRPTDRRR